MKYPQFVVVLVGLCLHGVKSECQRVDWSQSFETEGLSKCNGYIRRFVVNGGVEHGGLGLLEGAECCTAPYPWFISKHQTVHTDWWNTFDSGGSVACPEGFFLRGFKRTGSSPGYLYNLEEGRCTKPADHPRHYKSCYSEDISTCIQQNGLCGCKDGYFVVGLERDNCDKLRCLKKLKCCEMVNQSEPLTGLDSVKERIMDVTQSNMAMLGNYLGYGWAGGCREPYVGEGYKRVGDVWEADESSRCEGYKSDHRLNMAYGDWGFELINIVYGEPKVAALEKENFDSGTVKNNDSVPLKKTISREITTVREVNHIATDIWEQNHNLGIKLRYAAKGASALVYYDFSYRTMKTTVNSDNTQDTKKFIVSSEKTLEPYTTKKWKLTLFKSRTTLPYTATIRVKFSVDFQGFLRWGGGRNGGDTNYHHQYRGSEDRPAFHYKFGDVSVPFYTALKEQSSKSSLPWEWFNMKNRYPYAQSLIDDLTDVKHYEFTLNGVFDDVMGTSVDLTWEQASKRKRELFYTSPPKNQIFKYNLIAKLGPKDTPAHVEKPNVFLDTTKVCDFDVPVNISYLV